MLSAIGLGWSRKQIVLFFLAQRVFMEGVTVTGVKG